MSYFLGERVCPVCPETVVNTLMENNICPTCGYVYAGVGKSPIETACIELIEGVGGLDDYEYYEMATMNVRREIGIVMYTVRSIGNNPDSELAKAIREKWLL